MAKDNDDGASGSGDGRVPSSSGKPNRKLRSKPYDANNSFVKKVATKVTDFIPQPSWISKWFNNSQEEPQTTEVDNPEHETYEDKQSQPPPLKRPRIRMDVTHPPGTFTIKPRSKNVANETETSKEYFSNHNETAQDFLEPSGTGARLPRFVSSTPAYSLNTQKSDTRQGLNTLMPEQNNNGATNGTDDHSESSESTSGCSSLIPQNNRQDAPSTSNYNSPFGNKRRYIDDKFSFTNHLQSPRQLFLDSSNRETLSSRRPSFNPSVVNNTLERSASLSSPFYTGPTMFGGANAANLYRRGSSVLSEPSNYHLNAPKRASVQVNPSASESSTIDHSGMSQTARRILEALEQFSSPLSDAKKMPVRNLSNLNQSTASMLSTPLASRKRAREDESNASPRVGFRHLTRELTVPTVPDLLKIRRRQKLQNTTVNARKIMSARSAPAAPSTSEYHIRTEVEPEPKRSASLKAKKKTNLEEQETIEVLNLPSVPLPISNLPRFDISLPQSSKSNIFSTPIKRQQPPSSPMSPSDKENPFKFASPIKLTDGAKSLESINNFTFSKPISPSKATTPSSPAMNDSHELSKTLSVNSNDSLTSTPSFPNFIWAGPSQTNLNLKEKPKQVKEEEPPKGPKVASELKTGSVMDFFSKKPVVQNDSSSVWECSECLIKNSKNEKHCIACKSGKPDDDDSDIEIIECPNDTIKDSKKKFNAEPREDTKFAKSNTKTFGNISSNIFGKPITAQSTSSPKTNVFNSTISSFGSEKPKVETTTAANITSGTIKPSTATITSTKTSSDSSLASPLSTFKSVKSSWECPCCMVRNVDPVTTCPCCQTAKPGSVNISPKRTVTSTPVTATITSGFGDKFKKPEGSWSCDVCMVQNKAEASKCAACETPKPGAAANTTTKSSSSSSLTSSSFSGFGDKFKKPEGSWTCDACMISNKSDATKCIACETPKAGGEVAKSKSTLQIKVDMPANAGSFKFGIDKAEDAAKSSSSSTSNLPKTNGFTFGGSSGSQTSLSTGFSFGMPSGDKTKETNDATKLPSFGFKPIETVAAAATFQFGAKPVESKDKEEEKKPTATANFSFGAPTKSDVKPASAGFVFGSPTSTDNKEKEKSELKPIGAGFSFGASPATTKANKDVTTDKISKPATATTALPTINFSFGSPKPVSDLQPKDSQKKDEMKPAETLKPAISFGTPAVSTEAPKPATTPTFSFGAAAASTTSSSTNAVPASGSSLFTFTGSAKSTNSLAPLPAFGSPAAPKPAFSFGKPAETTAAQQTENKAPVLSFGSPATTTAFGSQTNQATSSLFGNISATASPATPAVEPSKPLLFGTPEPKKPSFGEPQNKLPAFGAATDNKPSGFPSATSAPAFGSPAPAANTASPFGTSTNVFGAGNTPSTFGTNATPSIFSASKPPETASAQTPGLFSFGQSSQATAAPTTGGFNFSAGSNATATAPATDQKALFSFGASSSTNQPVGTGFGAGTFGAAAAAAPAAPAATATPSFTFNAPKPDATATSSFGQAPTTTPMFNAPSAQPTGQPPAYPGTATPAPATGGFNFGNAGVSNAFSFGNPSTASPGGYNFNAPGTAPAPTFDPNAQPTFNFTAGSGAPTAFNAPPAAVQPGRKIKKAVRRMPRQ